MIRHTLLILMSLAAFTACRPIKLYKVMNSGSVSRKDFFVVVPFEKRMGMLIVKAEIHGKTYDFLVDTGAPNVISKELAAELKLKKRVSQKTGDSQGGSDKLDFVTIDSLGLNGLTFLNTGAAVADFSQSHEIACLGVDGFIGANLMKNAVWQIDYQGQSFTIVSSREQLIIPEEKIVLPFKAATSGTPLVDLEYNGVKDESVTFDTGSNGSFGSRKAGLDQIIKDRPETKTVIGFGRNSSGLYGKNTADTTYYALSAVKIKDETFPDQIVKFKQSQAKTIGNEFLKNFVVIIDWSEKEIFLIKRTEPKPEDENGFGFSPNRSGDKLLVSFIMSGSQAEKSGLQIGDQVLKIDGADYSLLTDELWCGLLYKGIAEKSSDVLTIETMRDDKKVTTVLNRSSIFGK